MTILLRTLHLCEVDRGDVNPSNIQYFLLYSLGETTSIRVARCINGNWEQDEDDRWTAPIGSGLQLQFIRAARSALFNWMQ